MIIEATGPYQRGQELFLREQPLPAWDSPLFPYASIGEAHEFTMGYEQECWDAYEAAHGGALAR